MINSNDLIAAITPIWTAVTHYDSIDTTVRCQDGKLHFLNRHCLIQVDNKTTDALPNFLMHSKDVSLLLNWLECDTTVAVETNDNYVVFKSNGSSLLIKSAPSQLGEHYVNVEEIITQNKLDNDYWFTLPKIEWGKIQNKLSLGKEFKNSLVLIDIDKDGGSFTVVCSSGAIKEKFNSDKDSSLPVNWHGNFSAEILSVDLLSSIYCVQPEVKFSFCDNTNSNLSSLMLEYQNGVTLVVPGNWK